jgi:CheY-like chemotaxis protein
MTTVLLVDDNPGMLKVIGLILQESGYRVIAAEGAEQGLTLLRETVHQPDLIISDMVMPIVDGMNLLEYVRSTPGLISTPFILMSGFTSAEMQQKAFQLGADAFLSKPFQFDTLNNTIHNLGLETPARA